jgi:hypothetical protein
METAKVFGEGMEEREKSLDQGVGPSRKTAGESERSHQERCVLRLSFNTFARRAESGRARENWHEANCTL